MRRVLASAPRCGPESLGVTNAADVLLVADKPIERSPMATPTAGRDVPEQWRASIRAYAQLFRNSMKKLPKACMPEVKLSEFVTLVELSELYTGSLVKLPIIKGSQKQGDAPLPAVVTIERGT